MRASCSLEAIKMSNKAMLVERFIPHILNNK